MGHSPALAGAFESPPRSFATCRQIPQHLPSQCSVCLPIKAIGGARSRYSSGSRSSDEGGQQRALLTRRPTFVRVKLLEVVLPKAGSTPRSPARMRTMTALRQFGRTKSLPRGNHINHISAAALARNVRSNGYGESRTERFGDQTNVLQKSSDGPTLKLEGQTRR